MAPNPPSLVLPSFHTARFRRNQTSSRDRTTPTTGSTVSDTASYKTSQIVGVVDIKRATRTRKHAVVTATLCFFIAVVFLILVEIGNTHDQPVLRSTYFISLNLANIIPESVPDAVLINSVAQSLGLHDFYQVGLWNFCEGDNGVGIVDCSTPQDLYWFNPVEILLNELLAGATIALPADVNSLLNLIKLASNVMFSFFLAGLVLNFVCIFTTWVVVYTRWWALLTVSLTFLAAILTTAATVVATVMFIIFKEVITSQNSINIGASIGVQMFAFMWVATACSLLAFIIHLGLTCCCASRRDIRTGRKKGSQHAYSLQFAGEAPDSEKTS